MHKGAKKTISSIEVSVTKAREDEKELCSQTHLEGLQKLLWRVKVMAGVHLSVSEEQQLDLAARLVATAG